MGQYCLPVSFDYDGQKYIASMGPFNHSTEREFALTVSRKAIDDCKSLEQLKQVSMNLLEGWASMQTAVQSLMLENIQLRQAIDKKNVDLEAANELLSEASQFIEHVVSEQKLAKTKKRLWPWSK
jgi:hypothetical protein